MILCKCGCGQPVKKGRGGKWNMFISGHNRRGKKHSSATINSMRRPCRVLDWDNLPLCACGCGARVSHPDNKFISGHFFRGKKRPEHSVRMSGDGNPAYGKFGDQHPKSGHKHSDEARRKQSEALSGSNNPNYGKFGELNSNWRGGKSFEPYSYEFNKRLKKEIRKRDNFTCQVCGCEGKDIHHIDYNKENCSKENLITTCNRCNVKANFDREYWEFHLKLIQIIRGVG